MKKRNRRCPDRILHRINEIERRLQALSNPEDRSGCSVDPVAKEKARIYIQSWILPSIEQVKAWAKGGRVTYTGHYIDPDQEEK